ncbi:MAG: single-stranded-DNA-specific exonuclease RecJ [Ruthenibacterium lactatiformans]
MGWTPEAARAVRRRGRFVDPMLLSGMEAAVARIHRAIDDGERIAVFGDYDVDGVTATALLYTYLDSAGADVYYKLPSRDDDGYGLSETAVDLMAAKGVSLIVTVDNGVSANAAIAHAKEQGVDVVVTDHHLPPQTLPEAAAIVNPQLPGDESPCKTLSGAGVAFKLAAALTAARRTRCCLLRDLAAIGTIADIMLLEGENRRIVKAGLALLQQTERPGIAALIEACGLGGKELTAENVSFGLAPRLNAAGRMDSAAAALELLLCEDPEEAEAIVAGLEAQNAARQKAEQDILQGVLDSVAADETYGADRILVVWGRGYHQGVIGIVASRVVERFGKPAIIVSVDENGEGKGPAAHRGRFAVQCHRRLRRPAHPVGGHALAAGLSREENLPAFRKAVNAWAAQEHPVLKRPALRLDARAGAVRPERRGRGRAVGARAVWPRQPHAGIFVENAVIDAVYPLSEGSTRACA